LDRRTVLRAALTGAGAAAFSGSLWAGAFAAPGVVLAGAPYGPPGSPDPNGVALPSGFTSRVVARSGTRVAPSSLRWHDAPDGGACFPDGAGWIYVSNSEIDEAKGGASAIRFGPDGAVRDAYRILSGTYRNCAGGATPWGTWLSCEERRGGYVFETYPLGGKAAGRRPAMGRFTHEAAACDPERKVIYLTEDENRGCFYRFRPTRWGDLSTGVLEVLTGAGVGPVGWARVPDPSGAAQEPRKQVPGAMIFNGGEGCWYDRGTCYFTTKGDGRVWAYDAVGGTLRLLYAAGPGSTLTGVDNVTGSVRTGDLFVAEDGGNMEINIVAPDGLVAPFLRLSGQDGSEITGPAFSPDGTRLYFSSQRGTTGRSSGGITYEVRGPFRTA
jgi:secreted PhoX family phosphatase